jgi:2-phosphosulfolactate phosphatase
MRPTLNVYALPKLVEAEELAGSATAVIDVLRASTTIVYALEAGARQVIPCLEIADALALAEQLAAEDVVLGGERAGVAIECFQLGNSPEEYSADRVGGKTVVLTTTNGTRAMVHARQAELVLVASFPNAAAIVAKLLDYENISILCAGTDGLISDDDVLLAGLLVDRLQRQAGMVYQLNAQALTARETWLSTFALPQALGAEPLAPERLAERLRKSLGAKNLLALGLDADVLAAAQLDSMDVVPRLDPQTFRISRA